MQSRIDRIHAACPDTQIIFVSPNTLPGRPEDLRPSERIGERTKALCAQYDFTYYVDETEVCKQYLAQYPVGWDTWTHLTQDGLAHLFGTLVLPTVREAIDKKGFSFTPDQFGFHDPYLA